jgi:hypothetical protein
MAISNYGNIDLENEVNNFSKISGSIRRNIGTIF